MESYLDPTFFYPHDFVCVCFDSLRPSQQVFSHVATGVAGLLFYFEPVLSRGEIGWL